VASPSPHFIPDNVPGSYLVISHATHDSVSREESLGAMSSYDKASVPIVPRGYSDALKFFDG
jgi:hypothetical protein